MKSEQRRSYSIHSQDLSLKAILYQESRLTEKVKKHEGKEETRDRRDLISALIVILCDSLFVQATETSEQKGIEVKEQETSVEFLFAETRRAKDDNPKRTCCACDP